MAPGHFGREKAGGTENINHFNVERPGTGVAN
jgi:hypothetical protein